MQKALLLLPLLCLVFAAAHDKGYSDSSDSSDSDGDYNSQPAGVQLILKANTYPCTDGYVELTSDSQLFNDVVCVKTTIQKTNVVKGACPAGTASVSYNEVAADTKKYCKLIGKKETVRIGFMGSLSGSSKGCVLSDFDASKNIAKSICVKRTIKDTELAADTADVCGAGQELVNQDEALANQAAYCKLLGEYDIIRLANGGSMDGPGYNCKIRYEDRRDLGGALCRNL